MSLESTRWSHISHSLLKSHYRVRLLLALKALIGSAF